MKRSEKGLRQTLNRKGTKADKSPRIATRSAGLRQPAICERCGAVYSDKTWRAQRRPTVEFLDRANWTICPACKQVESETYFGRVLASGTGLEAHRDAIDRRVANVVRLAVARQPERKMVSHEWRGDELEVLTTSQKLAHRIARELTKTFHGKAVYRWSDNDGSLLATVRFPAGICG